jgi:hypothetical protein
MGKRCVMVGSHIQLVEIFEKKRPFRCVEFGDWFGGGFNCETVLRLK